jgi:hypothetical protein
MSEEKQTPELDDPYVEALARANAEIERITGGITSHIAWFEGQCAANHRLMAKFILEIHDSSGVLPILAFKSLLDLMMACNRHIWCLWLVKDDLPAQMTWTSPFPDYGRPN